MPTHLMLTTALETSLGTSRGSAQMLYASWLSAVRSCNAQRVAELYAADAILRGTLSSEMRSGSDAVHHYFDWFLDRDHVGVKSLVAEFREISPGVVIAHGDHEFALGEKRGAAKDTIVKARFTFVFRREQRSGKWLIVDHHSSQFPCGPESMEGATSELQPERSGKAFK